MTFDPSQPQDITKLRNAPALIRNNFQAIQSGDSSFSMNAVNIANRDTNNLSSDPSPIENNVILYCKTSSSGNSDLYVLTPNNNPVQLTSATPEISNLRGSTTLLGGVKLCWGTLIMGNDTSVEIVGLSQIFSINFCMQSKGSSSSYASVKEIVGNKVTVLFSNKGANNTCWYIAVGM